MVETFDFFGKMSNCNCRDCDFVIRCVIDSHFVHTRERQLMISKMCSEHKHRLSGNLLEDISAFEGKAALAFLI